MQKDGDEEIVGATSGLYPWPLDVEIKN